MSSVSKSSVRFKIIANIPRDEFGKILHSVQQCDRGEVCIGNSTASKLICVTVVESLNKVVGKQLGVTV